MSSSAARRFLTERPTGKVDRVDRRGLRELWSLLYRAVRRQHVAVSQLITSVGAVARRMGQLSMKISELESRLEALERRTQRDAALRRHASPEERYRDDAN